MLYGGVQVEGSPVEGTAGILLYEQDAVLVSASCQATRAVGEWAMGVASCCLLERTPLLGTG